MREIIQGATSIFFGVIFGLFLMTLMFLHPQPENPHSYETVSHHYDISQKQAITRSVNSAVRVAQKSSLISDHFGFEFLFVVSQWTYLS